MMEKNKYRNTFISAVAAIALIAPELALADNFKRIRKAKDFHAHVVGKKIILKAASPLYMPMAKTNGKLKKKGKYHGAWTWQGGYYCRNLIIGGKETGTNCQKVEIAPPNKLRMTRDKGKGRVTMATME